MRDLRKKSSWKKVLFGVLAVFFLAASYILFCPEAHEGEKQTDPTQIVIDHKRKGEEAKKLPLELFQEISSNPKGIPSAFWFMERDAISSLRTIAQDWSLVLCVMESCSWCEKFSPIVAQLSKIGGFEVYALSFEEGRCGPFQVHDNPEFFDIINPEGAAPLLFLARKEGNDLRPIARGHTGLEEIIKNIQFVLEKDL